MEETPGNKRTELTAFQFQLPGVSVFGNEKNVTTMHF